MTGSARRTPPGARLVTVCRVHGARFCVRCLARAQRSGLYRVCRAPEGSPTRCTGIATRQDMSGDGIASGGCRHDLPARGRPPRKSRPRDRSLRACAPPNSSCAAGSLRPARRRQHDVRVEAGVEQRPPHLDRPLGRADLDRHDRRFGGADREASPRQAGARPPDVVPQPSRSAARRVSDLAARPRRRRCSRAIPMP